MSFSLKLGTSIHTIRVLLRDRDGVDPLFQDEELEVFLGLAGQNPRLAAASAYRALIREISLTSKVVVREGYESISHAISDMRRIADDLVTEDTTMGGLQISQLVSDGEHFDDWRPDWRSVDDFDRDYLE